MDNQWVVKSAKTEDELEVLLNMLWDEDYRIEKIVDRFDHFIVIAQQFSEVEIEFIEDTDESVG